MRAKWVEASLPGREKVCKGPEAGRDVVYLRSEGRLE